MTNIRKVYFYGRFPAKNEVGGVTTFTYDVANTMNKKTTYFIDMWNTAKKIVPNNVGYSVINRKSILGILKIFFLMMRPKTTHFFNFSNSFVVIFFCFLPKFYAQKWVVIFHNGEQEKSYTNRGKFLKLLFRIGINRFDRIGYISELQNKFFTKVYKGKLMKISPLIKTDRNIKNIKDNKNSRFIILLSGFPSDIYRLLETLDIIKDVNSKGIKIYVNICIYGEANLSPIENLTDEIERFAKENSWVNLFSHIDRDAFFSVMLNSSIYLRMNSEDSFGLVVAEAIQHGIPVIATNVCERYPGTHLIEKDNFNFLKKVLVGIVNGKKLDSLLPIQPVSAKAISVMEFSNFNEK